MRKSTEICHHHSTFCKSRDKESKNKTIIIITKFWYNYIKSAKIRKNTPNLNDYKYSVMHTWFQIFETTIMNGVTTIASFQTNDCFSWSTFPSVCSISFHKTLFIYEVYWWLQSSWRLLVIILESFFYLKLVSKL